MLHGGLGLELRDGLHDRLPIPDGHEGHGVVPRLTHQGSALYGRREEVRVVYAACLDGIRGLYREGRLALGDPPS
jgi:hypothetical protein